MKHVVLLMVSIFASSAVMADPVVEGDAEAGKAKAVACAACHGADGNSANPEWPKLAGQHPAYIVESLQAYKSGARANALMAGQAAALSEDDMRNIALYYGGLEQTAGVADPAKVEAGQALYRGGNAESGVAACNGCHGPAGLGNPAAAYPRVSGQHAPYLVTALKAYRAGERGTSDRAAMMTGVAANMTDAEIDAVASYLQGLQ